VLNAQLYEVNDVLTTQMSVEAPPELVILTLIDVLLVSVVLVEYILVWLL